jgi:methylated-DNA-[protein]-cysteine S-methyltransferase
VAIVGLGTVPVTSVSYTARDWGVGEVWFEDGRLVWHELPRPGKPAARRETSRGTRARARARVTPTRSKGGVDNPPPSRSTIPAKVRRGGNGSAPIADELVHRLEAYFAAERVSFDDVDLDIDGWTTFQLDIARALRRVPYGEVVSYGDLARIAGYPRAQRAAGTFCARNRFGIVVPCHRVVGADGLGSYGSLGLEYKKRLLALEGVTL